MDDNTLGTFLAAAKRRQDIADERLDIIEDTEYVTREDLAEWETAFLAKLERRLAQERAYMALFTQMRTSIAARILQRLRAILPGAFRPDYEYDEWLKQRTAATEPTPMDANQAWKSI